MRSVYPFHCKLSKNISKIFWSTETNYELRIYGIGSIRSIFAAANVLHENISKFYKI